MARVATRVNQEWATRGGGVSVDIKTATLEVLMDIRAELRRLNSLMRCSNTVQIPRTLKKIDRRLATKLPLRKGSA